MIDSERKTDSGIKRIPLLKLKGCSLMMLRGIYLLKWKICGRLNSICCIIHRKFDGIYAITLCHIFIENIIYISESIFKWYCLLLAKKFLYKVSLSIITIYFGIKRAQLVLIGKSIGCWNTSSKRDTYAACQSIN